MNELYCSVTVVKVMLIVTLAKVIMLVRVIGVVITITVIKIIVAEVAVKETEIILHVTAMVVMVLMTSKK